MSRRLSESFSEPALCRPYLERWGDRCISYSSLQSGMEYFCMKEVGCFAFQRFWHPLWAWKERTIVLGNPIALRENYSKLLQSFLEKYPRSMFVQFDSRFASALNELDYEVNPLGTETELLLDDFSLKGKARSQLRQWRNRARREGVEVREIDFESVSITPFKKLSDAWLTTKGGKEFAFLTRPLQWKQEKDVRTFAAYQQNILQGFAVFDPIYRHGRVIGYYHNVDRLAEVAPSGTSAMIVLQAMEVFQREQRELVSLGLSPLFGLDERFRHRASTLSACRYAFHHLNFLYPFRGNAQHKKKFAGQRRPVYFSSTQGNSLRELFILMKVLKLF